MRTDLRPATPARACSRSKAGAGGGSSMVGGLASVSGGGLDSKVVKAHVALPVVDAQVLVPRARERLRVGPREKGLAIDLPVDRAPTPRHRPVIRSAGLDARVGALGLATVVVLVEAAQDREAVVPAAEDQHVPGRRVGAAVVVE